MGIISTYSGELPYLLAFAILARRAKFSWKQSICLFTGGLLFAQIITTIQNVGNSMLRNGFFSLFIVAFIRLYIVLGHRRRNTTTRDSNDKCSLGVFMGSGKSHLRASMSSWCYRWTYGRNESSYIFAWFCTIYPTDIRLLSWRWDVTKDNIRTRVLVWSLGMSRSRKMYPRNWHQNHKLLALPRARKVGEGRISTLFSATKTLIITTWHTLLVPLYHKPMKPWVDVLILNGPGTALILVAVAWIRRVSSLTLPER